MAFIAYHFNWNLQTILDLEHSDRRRFIEEVLGIDLHPDVLPFSNLAAHLPPFLLRPDLAMTLIG